MYLYSTYPSSSSATLASTGSRQKYNSTVFITMKVGAAIQITVPNEKAAVMINDDNTAEDVSKTIPKATLIPITVQRAERTCKHR